MLSHLPQKGEARALPRQNNKLEFDKSFLLC